MKTKDIQIFNNEEFGEVRVKGTPDNPWFCLADICRALGISNSRNVKSRLDEGDVRQMDTPTKNQYGAEVIQQLTYINESGLYEVIIRSDSEKAKPFRKWVTSEVLPSIRKHGVYTADPALQQTLDRLRTKEVAMEAMLEGVPLYTADELRMDVGLASGHEVLLLLKWFQVLEEEDYGWEVNEVYVPSKLITFKTSIQRRRGKDRLTRTPLFTDRGRLLVRYIAEQFLATLKGIVDITYDFKFGIFPTISTPLCQRAAHLAEKKAQNTVVVNNN